MEELTISLTEPSRSNWTWVTLSLKATLRMFWLVELTLIAIEPNLTLRVPFMIMGRVTILAVMLMFECAHPFTNPGGSAPLILVWFGGGPRGPVWVWIVRLSGGPGGHGPSVRVQVSFPGCPGGHGAPVLVHVSFHSWLRPLVGTPEGSIVQLLIWPYDWLTMPNWKIANADDDNKRPTTSQPIRECWCPIMMQVTANSELPPQSFNSLLSQNAADRSTYES
jgi:hypothetical protein